MSHQIQNSPCGAVRMLALVSFMSAAFGVSAQSTSSSDEKSLAPVVVTASRVEQAQADTLPHTTVITSEDIRRTQAVDLPSLLRYQAGVQVNQPGGMGNAPGLFLRGAETRQTLVLIDGVPMMKQDAAGGASIHNIMLANIDRVEIVRGNVSAIYGSGAIGGVIQIFTKTGKGPAQFNATAEVGSRDTRRLAAGVSGAAGNFNYSLSASHFKTDGFSAQNPRLNASADPDDDGYENQSISGRFGYELAQGHELGIRFLSAEGDLEYDDDFTPDAKSTTKTKSYTVYTRNKLTSYWDSDLSVSEITDDYVDNSPFSAKTKTIQSLWSNNFLLSPNWTATAGFEYRDEQIASASDFDTYRTKRDVWSAFAGVLGMRDRHSLQLNVRYDDYESIGSADTGYIGYGYEFMPGYKFIASYSTSFTAPTLGELYSGFGNPLLKPEEIDTKEIGFQYAKGSTLLKVVAFDSSITNQIQYNPAASQSENIGKVSNQGIEVTYLTTLAGLDLRSSLTLQDPVDERDQQTLLRRAETLASVGVSKSFGALNVGTDWQYTGKRRDLRYVGFTSFPTQLSSFVVGNITARYALTKQVTLFGRVENVTDEIYENAYGFNQTPRSYFVGVSWQH